MKKIVVSAGLALALLGVAGTAAFAHPHHWRMDCHWYHHHKVCHKVWY
jgi:hypothetical protein